MVCGASLTLLIAVSRLYLGAHWLSDVIGGLAFGTAWLALLGVSHLRQPPEPIRPAGLLIAGCAALALAGGYNVYRRHTVDVGHYAVRSSVTTMVAADWWAADWQQVAANRIDLAGEIEEPLTFQWAGSLQELQDLLLQKGWRIPASWTPLSTLTWLSAAASPVELPVMPFFTSGRLPSLTLVQPYGDAAPVGSRLVLRLWAVDIELTNGKSRPVWVGSVVQERLYRPVSLFTVASTQSDMNRPREVLAAALGGGRLASRTGGLGDASWDRRVLLAREGHLPCLSRQ